MLLPYFSGFQLLLRYLYFYFSTIEKSTQKVTDTDRYLESKAFLYSLDSQLQCNDKKIAP